MRQSVRFSPTIGGFIPAQGAASAPIERNTESTTDQSSGWMS